MRNIHLHAGVAASFILIALTASAAVGQPASDVVVIVPLPTEELFVDPIADTLDPRYAEVDPREAEIQRARFDVRPARAELPRNLADERIAELEPDATLFLDPTSRANELTDVESVAAGGTGLVLNRLARRASYRELANTRRSRFGRPETVRPRPPLEPSRPFGPRPTE